MARREFKPGGREEPRRAGKRGGLFLGLLIGLAIGLAAAAGLAWYFNIHGSVFKPREAAPSTETPAEKPTEEAPAPPRRHPKAAPEEAPAKAKPEKAKPGNAETPAEPSAPIRERKPFPASKPSASEAPARVPLTFYGILPGEKPAKAVEPPKPSELWWLQVAALKDPADADKLKARLALLGLEVSTQKIESAGQTLYRVRVGPYKRDDDAFADLDTLAANNYEPRLLKEPVKP